MNRFFSNSSKLPSHLHSVTSNKILVKVFYLALFAFGLPAILARGEDAPIPSIPADLKHQPSASFQADVDGVISSISDADQFYSASKPVASMVDAVSKLKAKLAAGPADASFPALTKHFEALSGITSEILKNQRAAHADLNQLTTRFIAIEGAADRLASRVEAKNKGANSVGRSEFESTVKGSIRSIDARIKSLTEKEKGQTDEERQRTEQHIQALNDLKTKIGAGRDQVLANANSPTVDPSPLVEALKGLIDDIREDELALRTLEHNLSRVGHMAAIADNKFTHLLWAAKIEQTRSERATSRPSAALLADLEQAIEEIKSSTAEQSAHPKGP